MLVSLLLLPWLLSGLNTMDQEESMIKPPPDTEQKKRERCQSSPCPNYAGLTMLIITLVLSVAALWIPWQRFALLEKDIQMMEARYEELLEIINKTR